MRPRSTHMFVPTLLAAAVACAACERPAAPLTPNFGTKKDKPPQGCNAARKFTGGGRIDPFSPPQKITFGFNVHADDYCASGGAIKGQVQIVHHPTQSKVHSISLTDFSSYREGRGECATFGGTARVKHGSDDWHTHTFRVEACDNGEPGRGNDTFAVSVPDHGFATGRTLLTGGNIQAHK